MRVAGGGAPMEDPGTKDFWIASAETEVRFSGEPGHESASGSDRTNLPETVEPGVTYRNVRIDYRAASRLVMRRRSR